jgi:hypothetical protein
MFSGKHKLLSDSVVMLNSDDIHRTVRANIIMFR